MRYLPTITAAAIILAGCAGEQTTAPTATEDVAPQEQAGDEREETIDIVDFAFEPDDLEVPVGTTVTWTQSDPSRHTVDFDDGEESGELEQGDTFTRTFDEAGTHDYVCFFHPRMTASVTVTD